MVPVVDWCHGDTAACSSLHVSATLVIVDKRIHFTFNIRVKTEGNIKVQDPKMLVQFPDQQF